MLENGNVMASLDSVRVDAKKICEGITIELTIRRMRQFRWRLRIALFILFIASWIAWVDFVFVEEDELNQ